MNGIDCPECGGGTVVVDTRETNVSIMGSKVISRRRRRDCDICGVRFTTYEISTLTIHRMTRIFNKTVEMNALLSQVIDEAKTEG